MNKEMEKKREEEAKQESKNLQALLKEKDELSRKSVAVATPGRLANATPKFMPKKRGRIGLQASAADPSISF